MPTVFHLAGKQFFGGSRPPLNLDNFTQLTGTDDVLDANVLIIHLPSILTAQGHQKIIDLKTKVNPKQIWVADSLESAVHYPAMNDPAFMQLFDVEMSYRQSADIWTPYIPSDFVENLEAINTKPRSHNYCAFISSKFDKSGRRKYIEELMQHLNIHSYGRYLRNRRLIFDRGTSSKYRVLRKYNFTLAFENAIEDDYVTEKFFQPLICGSVPIYLGAPNINEYAPGENCFINTRDFLSPAHLAEYLQDVDLSTFHAWRRKPLNANFKTLLAKLETPSNGRLANLLTDRFKF